MATQDHGLFVSGVPYIFYTDIFVESLENLFHLNPSRDSTWIPVSSLLKTIFRIHLRVKNLRTRRLRPKKVRKHHLRPKKVRKRHLRPKKVLKFCLKTFSGFEAGCLEWILAGAQPKRRYKIISFQLLGIANKTRKNYPTLGIRRNSACPREYLTTCSATTNIQ